MHKTECAFLKVPLEENFPRSIKVSLSSCVCRAFAFG